MDLSSLPMYLFVPVFRTVKGAWSSISRKHRKWMVLKLLVGHKYQRLFHCSKVRFAVTVFPKPKSSISPCLQWQPILQHCSPDGSVDRTKARQTTWFRLRKDHDRGQRITVKVWLHCFGFKLRCSQLSSHLLHIQGPPRNTENDGTWRHKIWEV